MSFQIFADGTANLPANVLDKVHILPCRYTVDGVEHVYDGNIAHFDVTAYYDLIREGKEIKTSLINTQQFIASFTPVLEKGEDVIAVTMSSCISGTYQAGMLAVEELKELFPDRVVRLIDSKTCGMGGGMLALKAIELQEQGMDTTAAADLLDAEVIHCCSYFTVDNLKYLIHTGRVSQLLATAGAILDIKPILLGSNDGHIESCAKCRGRKKAIRLLAEKYQTKVVDPSRHIVAISHGDCPADAEVLASAIREIAEPKELIIVPHEPFSGAHVGPGMLGLFFYGEER